LNNTSEISVKNKYELNSKYSEEEKTNLYLEVLSRDLEPSSNDKDDGWKTVVSKKSRRSARKLQSDRAIY